MTMADLYRQTSTQLRTVWGGVGGERFYAKLRGQEVEEIQNEMGSIGHSHVLAPELRNTDDAFAVLHRLTQKAAMRLRKAQHYVARMQIKVKFLNASSWERETRLLDTQDTLDLLHALESMWASYKPKRSATPLQVGLTLLDLTPEGKQSQRLFVADDERKKLNATLDKLNQKYGKHAAYFGGAHRAIDHGKMAIAFNHIPDIETEK
jgi:DNA polymerase IV